MWIVRLALRRPYTFVVMALVIVILGVLSARTTPTDIFPKIDIPVISVVWTYGGLPAQQMEQQTLLHKVPSGHRVPSSLQDPGAIRGRLHFVRHVAQS